MSQTYEEVLAIWINRNQGLYSRNPKIVEHQAYELWEDGGVSEYDYQQWKKIEASRRHNLQWKRQQEERELQELQEQNRIKKQLIDLRVLIRQVEQAPITEYILPPVQVDGYTLTPEQAQLYLEYGGRYNIYDDHITEVRHHITKDTYRTHGLIGSLTFNVCEQCGITFFYIYRGGRSREGCPKCVDWTKKYPYDEVVSL